MQQADRNANERQILAEQDERRRLALFLHDGPVQRLSGIALMLDGALHAIESGDAKQAEEIIALALVQQRETIRELRSLSFVLEPVVLRDAGLEPALRALADATRDSHGVQVDLELDAAPMLGETASIALYTILRELLEQAVRRGPPRAIAISLRATEEGGVLASVSDDAGPERRRRAMEVIEERTRELHGTAEVVVIDAERSEVRVRLPAHTARR